LTDIFALKLCNSFKLHALSERAGSAADRGAPQEDWLERVTPVIQRRIEGYRGEVRFNLMAVIRSRRDALRERIAGLEARREALEAALPGAPLGPGGFVCAA